VTDTSVTAVYSSFSWHRQDLHGSPLCSSSANADAACCYCAKFSLV